MENQTCTNCLYFRQNTWCSNLGGPYGLQDKQPTDTCVAFTRRGQKAPLGLRLKLKVLGWLNRRIR